MTSRTARENENPTERIAEPYAGLKADIDTRPFGLDAVRPGLELAIRYCHQQGLIRRQMQVEELFDDVTIGLE